MDNYWELLVFGYIRICIETSLSTSVPLEIKRLCLKYKGTHYLDDSAIVHLNEEKNLLFDLIGEAILNGKRKSIHLTLLYRMSRDGKDLHTAHSKYNGKGPTLTLIKPKKFNHICGGYTSISWATDGGNHTDPDAFLILLRSQFKEFPPKIYPTQESHQSVRHWSMSGPSFGKGCALRIYQSSNSDAYSNPDTVYDIKGNELMGGDKFNETKKQHDYWLEDYEVFLVTLV